MDLIGETVRMAVAQIEGSEAFVREVLQAEGRVVVDFYADWCAPCRQVGPVIEALSEKWEGSVRFAKVDVDRDPEVASALGVSSIPVVAMFEGGEVRGFLVGAAPPHIIERELGLVEDDGPDVEEGAGVGAPPDRPARGFRATIAAWWRGDSGAERSQS
jgi:thioredoxin 1